MIDHYPLIKGIHVWAVAVSFALFLLRGVWMLCESPRLHAGWVRLVPHVVDTILLASAVTLAYLIRQAPGSDAWLTAKVSALAIYVVAGTIALKRGRTRSIRALAWVGALLVFAYIVAVARTHDPLPLALVS